MSKISPYDGASLISYDDSEVLMFANTEDVLTNNSIEHTLKEGDTLQSLAFQYYGDSGYWGLIARANKILNPFTEVIPGKRIIIP